MKDEGKTTKQLVKELKKMRKRISEMESFDINYKQSTALLEKNKEILRLIGENTVDLISINDLNGKYVYVSPSYKLLGYDPNKLIGKDGFKLLHPEDQKKFLPMLRQAISGILKPGEERRLDIRLRDKGGEYHDVESIARLIKNEAGEIQILSVIRDVTEQRQAEKEIVDNRNQFESIFKAIPAGIGVVVDRKFQFVNSKLVEMLGFRKEDLIGNLARMVYPSDAEFERVDEHKYDQIKEKGVGEIETVFQRKDGSLMDVLLSSAPINLEDLSEGVIFTVFDITDRKQADKKVNRFAHIFEESLNEIFLFNIDTFRFTHINNAAQKNLGYSIEELKKLTPLDIKPEFTIESFEELLLPLRNGVVDKLVFETIHKRKDKSQYNAEVHLQILDYEDESLFAAIIMDITGRKRAEEELRRYEQIVSSSTDMLALLDMDFNYLAANAKYLGAFNITLDDLIGRTISEVVGKERFERNVKPNAIRCMLGEQANFECWNDFPGYGSRYMDINYFPYLDCDNNVMGFVINGRDITLDKELKSNLEQEQKTAQNYLDVAGVIMVALNNKGVVTLINKKGCEIFGYQEEEILGKDWFDLFIPKSTVVEVKSVFQQLMRGEIENADHYENPIVVRSGEERIIYWQNTIIKDENGKIAGILSSGEDVTEQKEAEAQLNLQSQALESAANAIVITDAEGSIRWVNPAFTTLTGYLSEEVLGQNPRMLRSGQQDDSFYSQMWETILAGKVWQGEIINKRKDGKIYTEEMTIAPVISTRGEISNFIAIKQDITDRVQAAQTIKRQHQFTTALHDIDLVITSSQDLALTLNILIKHTLAQLEVDAVAIFLLDSDLQLLAFEVGTGFANNAKIRSGIVKLGQSFAGVVALEQKLLISDLDSEEISSGYLEFIRKEKFVSYAGAPLIAKGQVLGVIEIYQRTSLDPDPEWIRSFETLAGQAAIAIENITLFNDLQRANLELSLGYEQTIEGWAKTLEMRDDETVGHSQRVTEMTMILARKMGITAEEMIHVRRGALLHDIGKMNVPDRIMQKTGPLDEEEWKIMRKHTEYAYEFLAPIKFLGPALDIPRYHHEKWDGTGYPHKLAGDQIPLSARIFAIVDVFDALSSDRPYRKAWPLDKIINHIQEESGKHFDPAVVESFLEIQKK